MVRTKGIKDKKGAGNVFVSLDNGNWAGTKDLPRFLKTKLVAVCLSNCSNIRKDKACGGKAGSGLVAINTPHLRPSW